MCQTDKSIEKNIKKKLKMEKNHNFEKTPHIGPVKKAQKLNPTLEILRSSFLLQFLKTQ